LSSIEDVFNDIWGVKRTRGYLDPLTLYWTAVTVSPTLIVLGMSLPALLRRLVPLRWVLEHTGTVDAFFGIVVPWIFVLDPRSGARHGGGVSKSYAPTIATGVPCWMIDRSVASSIQPLPQAYSHRASRASKRTQA
jgi:hypothetical protein